MLNWTLHDLYQQMEMPIVPLVDRMQATGMKIDKVRMGELHELCQSEMERHNKEAAELAGKDPSTFNLASADQAAAVLYDEMGVKPPALTGSGKRGAIDEKARDRLMETLPEGPAREFVTHFDRMMHFQKMDTSYCDKAIQLADDNDRIYTTIKQTRAVNGRFTSAEPFNLMGIPKDTTGGPEAKYLRRGFVPRPGYTWVAMDYSQIDARATAHTSHDPFMSSLFIRDEDIHTWTASRMFEIPIEKVDKDKHRYPAKRVGFGTLFGLTAAGLMPHMPLESRKIEYCEYLINSYWDVYKVVAEHRDLVQAHAARYHWVACQWGRIRWIPEMASTIKRIVEEGKREAFSHYITSTAQGVIKIPMGHTLELIDRYKFDAQALIQVHDEMDFEVKDEDVKAFVECFGYEYANAVRFDVPIKLEVEAGPSWGELEPVATVISQ